MTVNINWLWVSRIAKVLALLLFFLPWMAVSCNGTPLIEASGYQLATGNPSVAQMPMAEMNAKGDDMDPVWWVIVAAVVILAGSEVGRARAAGLQHCGAGPAGRRDEPFARQDEVRDDQVP